MSATRFILLLTTMALVVGLPACGRHCVPEPRDGSGRLIDLSAAPNAHAPANPTLAKEVEEEFRRRAIAQHPPGARPYHFLALSSGGLYGAFGVGVMKGWTDSGTRPTFDVVTGISTGAVMSTFAFLGSQYDDFLYESLVGHRRRDFLRVRRLVAIPFGTSFYSSTPLARQIEKAITLKILAEVAAAHAAGRRLYVGTTNLDSSKLILWDMGAIASRCNEESLKLYRDVILASSSIPGAFPAVKLKVEVDGKMYDELHVDGGASDEVIFRAFMVSDLNRAAGMPGTLAPPGSTLHIISNGKLYADPGCVRRNLIGVLSAAANSVVYNKTRDEMYRIYLNCLQAGVEFWLTEVPRGLEISTSSLNVTKDEQALLARIGYQSGKNATTGEGWRDGPPGIDAAGQALPRAGTRFARDRSPRSGSAAGQPACASAPPPLLPVPPAVAAPPDDGLPIRP